MATIEKYAVTTGQRYRVRYRRPDGKQTDKRGFRTKRDAEAFAATVEVSKLRGEYVSATAGRTTIEEIGESRITARKATVKPSTWSTENADWQNRVKPEWGERAVSSITPSEIAEWVGRLSAEGLSATVVARCHGILMGILEVAKNDRRIHSNPARGVKLPRKTPKPRAYLTHRQVEALARECRDRGPIVLLLAYTGLRWGEMIALRVRSVNMLRRRLLVEENAPKVGGTPTLGTPKTHVRRSVPFPASLATALTEQIEGRGRDDFLFGDGKTLLYTPDPRDGWFASAVKRCQAEDKSFPRVTPHDLRHTAASLAISAGATPKAVQRMLGHASAAMTLDTYADLFEDDLDAVMVAVDAARVSECGQNVGTEGNSGAAPETPPLLPTGEKGVA